MATKLANPQNNQSQIAEKLKNVIKSPWSENNISDKTKVARITKHMRSVMKILGLDLTDDSLIDTPKRIAKMYVYELFSGLSPKTFPKITCIENKMGVDEMITVGQIKVLSVCEHHFVTIDGFATVSYIPRKKIIGLSKINRIVKYFSRRPQVQERLTRQIADCLEKILETPDVAVHIKAKHYCVISRGVEDSSSLTTTTDLRGAFKKNHSARSEFLKGTVK